MAHVLVICTGNICRSPMAEGFLRSVLQRRFGAEAPTVASAGTQGWEGSPAQPESIVAAREREVDIEDHVARLLTPSMIERADLVVAMAGEHREAVVRASRDAGGRSFTLKELVRLAQALPPAGPPDSIADRVAEADTLRRGGFGGNPRDEDVADPLGRGQDAYRAIAWELDELIHRLDVALFGPVTEPASIFGTGGRA